MPAAKYRGRSIQLITPTLGQAQKYQKLADDAGVPLSKFLISVIEDALIDKATIPKAKLSQGMKELREENHELRERLRIQSLLVSKFEQEVRQLRQAAFLDEQFDGERAIDSTILAVLRRGPIHDYRLLEVLGIDPKDTNQVRAVHKQLEVMELHGEITKDRQGWRWLGK